MGSDSGGLKGKLQGAIGSVLGGDPDKLPRADEDPDIEYPEPLNQEYLDDGKLILTKREGDDEEGDGEQDSAAAGGDSADAGTEDSADAGAGDGGTDGDIDAG